MMKWFLLLLLMILSACQHIGPAAIPTHDPALPRVVTATDETTGLIRLEYPADWLAEVPGDATITIGNTGAAILRYRTDITEIESGHVVGTVSALAKEALPDTVEPDLRRVMDYIIGTISAPTDGKAVYSFGTIRDLDVAGITGVFSDGLATTGHLTENPEDDKALDIRVMVLDADAAYGVLIFGGFFDELAPYQQTLEEIAAGFTFFTAPQVRATQTAAAP